MTIRARNSKPSEESSTASAPGSESMGELAVDGPPVGSISSSVSDYSTEFQISL